MDAELDRESKQFSEIIKPDKALALEILKQVKEMITYKDKYQRNAIDLMKTFYEEKIPLGEEWDRMKDMIDNPTPETVLSALFTYCLLYTSLPYSHALGETRIPANDVTLWDHSYSTASLYKSLLCQDLINGPVKPENSNWRLYGIFWAVSYTHLRGT